MCALMGDGHGEGGVWAGNDGGAPTRTQEVLDEANAGTFRELGAFARAQHRSPSKRTRGAHGVHPGAGRVRDERLVPAALTVAGGVNSVDHARTFPDLVRLLRAQARALQSLAMCPRGSRASAWSACSAAAQQPQLPGNQAACTVMHMQHLITACLRLVFAPPSLRRVGRTALRS